MLAHLLSQHHDGKVRASEEEALRIRVLKSQACCFPALLSPHGRIAQIPACLTIPRPRERQELSLSHSLTSPQHAGASAKTARKWSANDDSVFPQKTRD